MFFSKIYDGWEEIQREKYQNIFDVIGNEFLSELFSKKTLDIGYGTGFLKKFLDEKNIKTDMIGIDVNFLKERNFVLGDGDYLPFKKEKFDFIVSIDTMHLLGTDNFRHILKKRGYVLFGVFFNYENFNERRILLLKKLRGFEILAEFEVRGKENEYVVFARKRYI